MTDKIPASIPLAEVYKELAQECRDKAKHFLEWANIIEGKAETREEAVKFIYDILKKHSIKVNGVDVIPVSGCIALVDDLIEHEIDILKKFVGWYKEVLAKDFDKAFAESKESIDESRYWYCQGEATAFHHTIENIDNNSEKFLEENK